MGVVVGGVKLKLKVTQCVTHHSLPYQKVEPKTLWHHRGLSFVKETSPNFIGPPIIIIIIMDNCGTLPSAHVPLLCKGTWGKEFLRLSKFVLIKTYLVYSKGSRMNNTGLFTIQCQYCCNAKNSNKKRPRTQI